MDSRSAAYLSISSLAKQAMQAWEDTQKINFPQDYKNVKNIVLCGMGGSAYAALVIKSLYQDLLTLPLELVNGYNLPKYVDHETLVLLSSYSGSTEEVLSCAQEALTRKARITGVCEEGSKLSEFLKANNLPGYFFVATNNPSRQPRLGQGYMIFGHIGILAKIGLLNVVDKEITSAIGFLEQNNSQVEAFAKNFIGNLQEKIPVIVAAEHLSGNAYILRNQLNETAKNFATYSIIPELNHHLMEGLKHPRGRILTFIFLKSSLYSPVIQKRFNLTRQVIEKNNTQVLEVEILGKTVVTQMLYALSFGGFLVFNLANAYGEDPNAIPWVDYFKKRL